MQTKLLQPSGRPDDGRGAAAPILLLLLFLCLLLLLLPPRRLFNRPRSRSVALSSCPAAAARVSGFVAPAQCIRTLLRLPDGGQLFAAAAAAAAAK